VPELVEDDELPLAELLEPVEELAPASDEGLEEPASEEEDEEDFEPFREPSVRLSVR